MLFGRAKSNVRAATLPSEQTTAREDLVCDVVAAIERTAPGFKFIVFCANEVKHFCSTVPSNDIKRAEETNKRLWPSCDTFTRSGVWCDSDEFVVVDSHGDEIHFKYADLGYAPRGETREYLAKRVVEYFGVECCDYVSDVNKDPGRNEQIAVCGSVVYPASSLAEWRAWQDRKTVRTC